MKIIGNPSPADRQWTWSKEAKPAASDPESLASRADLVDARTPARELDALEAQLTLAFDQADSSGDIDLMRRLADSIDKVRATRPRDAVR